MTEARVTSSDRLLFTLFLAAIVHGLLILGLGFSVDRPQGRGSLLEVTLALTESSQEANPNADFLAQSTQEGSGTLDEAERLSTDQVSDFQDNVIREVQPDPRLASAPDQP
ncbi:MAG: energy transducer TonB, partial [Natronospirillum sp.]